MSLSSDFFFSNFDLRYNRTKFLQLFRVCPLSDHTNSAVDTLDHLKMWSVQQRANQAELEASLQVVKLKLSPLSQGLTPVQVDGRASNWFLLTNSGDRLATRSKVLFRGRLLPRVIIRNGRCWRSAYRCSSALERFRGNANPGNCRAIGSQMLAAFWRAKNNLNNWLIIIMRWLWGFRIHDGLWLKANRYQNKKISLNKSYDVLSSKWVNFQKFYI